MKLPVTVNDWSAVNRYDFGIKLSSRNFWILWWDPCLPLLLVKQLYGEAWEPTSPDPALAARCFLLISFAGKMTAFNNAGADGIAAQPLCNLKQLRMPA